MSRNSLAYQVGRFFGSRIVVVAIILAALAAFFWWAAQSAAESRALRAQAEAAEKARIEKIDRQAEEQRLAALKVACAKGGTHFAAAASAAKAGKVLDAFGALYPCREHLVDPDAFAMYQKGEAAAKAQEAADARKRAAEEKRLEAVAKAARRKEGVRIGMSQQDVLDSNWGKPDDINRTISARTTREQWVYRSRGRGYLYFENGTLTSIQN